MTPTTSSTSGSLQAQTQWFVMRDLKRPNAKHPAYKELEQLGFTVFTPLTVRLTDKGGKRIREQVPVIRDLLFVQSDRGPLDEVVTKTATLQYRYMKGHAYGTPMTVPAAEMARFIAAVGHTEHPVYYTIDQITPQMIGSRIRMVCDGPLNSFEGHLLKIRGARKKRLLVRLEGFLAAAVEIQDFEYIEVITSCC